MSKVVSVWLAEESGSITFVGEDTPTGYLTSKIVVSGQFSLHSNMVLIIDLGLERGRKPVKPIKVDLMTKSGKSIPANGHFGFVGNKARLTVDVNKLDANFICDELHAQFPNEKLMVLVKGTSISECGLTLNDLMEDHPYHNGADYIDVWPDLDSYLEEFTDADVDWNLVVRWDVCGSEVSNTSYAATIALFQQRKETIVYHRIENLKESDVDALVEYLTKHFKRIKENWAPLNK